MVHATATNCDIIKVFPQKHKQNKILLLPRFCSAWLTRNRQRPINSLFLHFYDKALKASATRREAKSDVLELRSLDPIPGKFKTGGEERV